MFNARSFYGSRKQAATSPPDWMVQSWVPNDGLDSDDPDCGGGDDGDLSSGSDWYDDGKNYYNTAIIKNKKKTTHDNSYSC